jgi:hypothetical protein
MVSRFYGMVIIMRKLVYRDKVLEFPDEESLVLHAKKTLTEERILPNAIWDGEKEIARNFQVAVYLHHMRSGQ